MVKFITCKNTPMTIFIVNKSILLGYFSITFRLSEGYHYNALPAYENEHRMYSFDTYISHCSVHLPQFSKIVCLPVLIKL